MAIQKTRWRPVDTCGCVISHTWDDSAPQEERVHTLDTIQKCAFHQADDDDVAYQNVLDENITKNGAIGFLKSNHPELFPDVVLATVPNIPSTVVLPEWIYTKDAGGGQMQLCLRVQYHVEHEMSDTRDVIIKTPVELQKSHKDALNIGSDNLFSKKVTFA